MKCARLLYLPLFAVLGACGGDAASEAERKTAAGEVLGGSISDEMLPLDTVTSQSPPLREEADGDDRKTGSGGSARPRSSGEPAPAEGEAEPGPTASAAPTTEASLDE